MNTVLVFAAHPDDEVLGCGGTIARHISEGDKVHVVILAEGIASRQNKINLKEKDKQISQLQLAAKKSNEILGTTSLKFFNFPDNRMDTIDLLDVIKKVENELIQISPNIVYTHFSSDLNIDHRIISQAVITACRPEPNQSVKKILSFEVQSSTEWQEKNSNSVFSPNVYIDISQTLELKLEALKAYESEMRPWPHSRSLDAILHLARLRGSNVGVGASEAFMLIRELK